MATRSIQRSEGPFPAPLSTVVPVRWARRFLARRNDELDAHLRELSRGLVGADARRVERASDASLATLGQLLEADRVMLFVRRGLLDDARPSNDATPLVPHRVWTPRAGLAPATDGGPGLDLAAPGTDRAELAAGRLVFAPLPRDRFGDGRVAASSLLVPCPGPEGPLAVIEIDWSDLAHGVEEELSERLEGLGLLLGGALDRVRLANELEHARRDRGHMERLETLGRVASAVAHDFNNVITAILGYSDLLEMEIEANGRGEVELSEIRDAANRAAGLVDQVLAFGRTRRTGAEAIEVGATISDLEGMLRQVLGDGIELVFDWDPEAAGSRVFLDPGRLGPIVLNLASNARGALEEVESGAQFRLSTRRVRIDADHPAPPSLVELAEPGPGEYVRLTAADNGCGLSRELARRVFEPFFTTKPSGAGTGLGLASTLEYVRHVGGGLGLESAPGAGASFHLYLPVVSGSSAADPATADD